MPFTSLCQVAAAPMVAHVWDLLSRSLLFYFLHLLPSTFIPSTYRDLASRFSPSYLSHKVVPFCTHLIQS